MAPTISPTTGTPTAFPTTASPTLSDSAFMTIRFVDSKFSSTVGEKIGSLKYIVGSILNVPVERVVINDVRSGSVIVDFEILNFGAFNANKEAVVVSMRELVAQDAVLVEALGDSSIELPFLDKFSPYFINSTSQSGGSASEGEICLETGDFVEYPSSFDVVQIVSVLFGAIGCLICIAGVVVIFIFRDTPVFLLVRQCFQVMLCVSFLVVNISSIIRTVGLANPTTGTCSSYIVFGSLGMSFISAYFFTLQYLAFTGKTRRRVANTDMTKFIAPIVGLASILVIVWITTTPPTPNPCSEFRCTSGNGGIIYVLFSLLLLLLGGTLIFSYLIRGVPSLPFESLAIILTSSFCAVGLGFVGLINMLQTASTVTEACLYSFTVCWCTGLGIGLLVIRKYWWIGMTDEDLNSGFKKPDVEQPDPNNDDFLIDQEKGFSTSHSQNILLRKQEELKRNMLEFDVDPPSNLPTAEEIELSRARGFKIGDAGEWEEFVDRDTGETFFVSTLSGEVTTSIPSK